MLRLLAKRDDSSHVTQCIKRSIVDGKPTADDPINVMHQEWDQMLEPTSELVVG